MDYVPTLGAVFGHFHKGKWRLVNIPVPAGRIWVPIVWQVLSFR